jgi:hypothetical protein
MCVCVCSGVRAAGGRRSAPGPAGHNAWGLLWGDTMWWKCTAPVLLFWGGACFLRLCHVCVCVVLGAHWSVQCGLFGRHTRHHTTCTWSTWSAVGDDTAARDAEMCAGGPRNACMVEVHSRCTAGWPTDVNIRKYFIASMQPTRTSLTEHTTREPGADHIGVSRSMSLGFGLDVLTPKKSTNGMKP